jgi:hypothetical protein
MLSYYLSIILIKTAKKQLSFSFFYCVFFIVLYRFILLVFLYQHFCPAIVYGGNIPSQTPPAKPVA